MALAKHDGRLAGVIVTGIFEDAIRFMAQADEMHVPE
jgi:hypothetical protein